MVSDIQEMFFAEYGGKKEDIRLFFAPGRVNLIGEHTDYNGGYVMPCALSFGTYLAVRISESGKFRFASANATHKFEIAVDAALLKTDNAWVNYPMGVIDQFNKAGHQFSGIDFFYNGDIPAGAGLSSSASLEMVTAVALNHLFGLNYTKPDMAKLCQKAENEFVGMNCGIMDQFASALGKKDHVVFLNCKTLNYVEIPLNLEDISLVIINTNKARGLVETKYNERRAECVLALQELQAYRRWKFLSEISIEDFEKAEHHISDDTIAKRAFHVIAENKRVLEAAKALHVRNLDYFGKLMLASHESLKTLYEVSCFELDVLVEEAILINGVLGARMTGGGFGGCTVNLVQKAYVEDFITQLREKYFKKTGLHADFYLPAIVDGAREMM